MLLYTLCPQKSEPPKHFAIQAETCTDLNKILHAWHDIHSELYTVVSQKSILSLRTNQILNNAAERQELSNAAYQSKQSNCLHQMFKVSSFGADTFTQSITPLIHCSVDNVLIKAMPLFNQSFFQMINVADLATVDSCWKRRPVKSLWKKNENLLNKNTNSYKILRWWLK